MFLQGCFMTLHLFVLKTFQKTLYNVLKTLALIDHYFNIVTILFKTQIHRKMQKLLLLCRPMLKQAQQKEIWYWNVDYLWHLVMEEVRFLYVSSGPYLSKTGLW